MLRKAWSTEETAYRIAEEAFKTILPDYVLVAKDFADLVKQKGHLVERLQDEVNMLRNFNRKLTEDYRKNTLGLERRV